jgi:hypothetical protein
VLASSITEIRAALDKKFGKLTTDDLTELILKMSIGDPRSLSIVVDRFRAFPEGVRNEVWTECDHPESVLMEYCSLVMESHN